MTVRPQDLSIELGSINSELLGVQHAGETSDADTVTQLFRRASSMYDVAVRGARDAGRQLAAQLEATDGLDAAAVQHTMTHPEWHSACVGTTCTFLWEGAKQNPEVVAQLKVLKHAAARPRYHGNTWSDADATAAVQTQKVAQALRQLQELRPEDAENTKERMCVVTGIPCSLTALHANPEYMHAVGQYKSTLDALAHKQVQLDECVQEARTTLDFASMVMEGASRELDSRDAPALAGGGVGSGAPDRVVADAFRANAVQLAMSCTSSASCKAIENTLHDFFRTCAAASPSAENALLHQVAVLRAGAATSAHDRTRALYELLTDPQGGVHQTLHTLTTHVPARAQMAAKSSLTDRWKHHVAGVLPYMNTYDAVGDRVIMV
jgi:hypothetical protein